MHRLIIPRWANYFVLLDSWTFSCPDLGFRHCICRHLTLTAGLASLHRCTVSISLNGHANCTVVESWLKRIAAHPPFPIYSIGMTILYMPQSVLYPQVLLPHIRCPCSGGRPLGPLWPRCRWGISPWGGPLPAPTGSPPGWSFAPGQWYQGRCSPAPPLTVGWYLINQWKTMYFTYTVGVYRCIHNSTWSKSELNFKFEFKCRLTYLTSYLGYLTGTSLLMYE